MAVCRLWQLRICLKDAAGNYPLGVALLNLKSDPNITLFLAPFARSSTPAPPNPTGVRSNPYDAGPGPKGKGKGKGKRSSHQSPRNFVGNGSRWQLESPSVLVSIANRVSVARQKQERNVRRVGTFVLNPSVRRTIACTSMLQIRVSSRHS